MFESIKIYKGEELILEAFIEQLTAFGYARKQAVSEEGDFSVKGDNVVIYPSTFEYPLRIEIENDRVSKIVSIDHLTFRSIEEHDTIIIIQTKKGRFYKKNIWREEDPIDAFVDMRPGDFVVHVDHGVGRYLGSRVINSGSGKQECLAIEYRDGDILYVNMKDIGKVQKYIYFQGRKPELYKLGGNKWDQVKKRVEKGVFKVARDILDMQARRASMSGFAFSRDTDWQSEMESKFPFRETEDQKKAVLNVKQDMESTRPMDRLLCGDVGYGKTEVALRAAFKAVMDNKQVAILVPTTILAEQHYNTFTHRFDGFPVNVQMLSRFKTKAEQARIVDALKHGSVDVIIGTHRLLSKDISFKELGLVIIDEEQRFGVRHKEKLKHIRLLVDVLTLTATPIPRTLYLALMGGKDISVINTPPKDRQPVDTRIIEFRDDKLKSALEFELNRKGQVFFVHNRIESIDKVAKRIKALVPGARLAIGHGQMSEHALEKTMMGFIEGSVDILVCTTIIESGIDIPNANTLIVDRAEHFGLAELYQLRGRVGRFTRQAFAYFIVRNVATLTQEEQRRLEAIKKFTELGAGFKVAMQDLELRGAGNILGVEQHGYIEQVGFDLYCRLLRRTVEELKADKTK